MIIESKNINEQKKTSHLAQNYFLKLTITITLQQSHNRANNSAHLALSNKPSLILIK